MKNSKTIFIARCALFCALYVALTYASTAFAYGPTQLRIAEGFTLLPLFYLESIPALFLGCVLSNIGSPFGVYDVLIGSGVTLVSAIITYFIGKKVKPLPLRIVLGGVPPVVLNAFILPFVWTIFNSDIAYLPSAVSILISQSIFVYGIGTPLTFAVNRLIKKNINGFAPVEFSKKSGKNANNQNLENENKKHE